MWNIYALGGLIVGYFWGLFSGVVFYKWIYGK